MPDDPLAFFACSRATLQVKQPNSPFTLQPDSQTSARVIVF